MKKLMFDPENDSRPYVAVNGILLKQKNDKTYVLLGKRINVAGDGQYYIPGGHVKLNETIEEALAREFLEETGVEVLVHNLVWLEQNMLEPHHLTSFCQVSMSDPKASIINTEPDKCEGWEWCDLNDLPKPLWLSLGEFAKRLKEYIRNNSSQKISYLGTGIVR